jgi:CheY-like chemotaxis protein
VRILVVEDQSSAAEALQLLLEADGHDVVVAASYEKAVELVEAAANTQCFDVTFLDLKLPDGDGRDLVALVKGKCPQTRIYLATGSAVLQNDQDGLRFEDTSELARKLGADGAIGKPIDYEQLCRLVQN